MVISKRCDKEKMIVLEKDNGRKKTKKQCWSGVFSCFGDSTVYELDVAKKEFEKKPIGNRVWSRFARKKKTVPIEIAGNAMDCEMKRRNSDRKKENNCKVQGKPEECPDQNRKQKQHKSISADKTTSDISALPVQHISSKGDFLSKSAPLCRMLDPVQTQTQLRTSNCNSPDSSRHSTPEISAREEDRDRGPTGKNDSSKIVPIITVVIILVLLFGRGFAIFCMCIYFYIVSSFKSELTENKDQMKKGNKEIDLNSEMHKKMVVLRGFLERDKKKPSSNLGSPSS